MSSENSLRKLIDGQAAPVDSPNYVGKRILSFQPKSGKMRLTGKAFPFSAGGLRSDGSIGSIYDLLGATMVFTFSAGTSGDSNKSELMDIRKAIQLENFSLSMGKWSLNVRPENVFPGTDKDGYPFFVLGLPTGPRNLFDTYYGLVPVREVLPDCPNAALTHRC